MTLKRWSLPLILFAGMVLATIHAPFDWPYFGILALPAAAWLARTSERPVWAGYLFGLGYFFVMMAWIRDPFAVGPPEYAWMAIPAWFLMALGLALFWLPIFVFQKRGAWSIAIMLGIMEYLRGWIFTGLPWGLFAYGFADTPIAENASLIGSYGLSMVIALSVLLLFGQRVNWQTALGLALIELLFVWHFLRPLPTDMRVASVQARAVQPNFDAESRYDPSLFAKQFDELIAASQGDAQIVVWPEGATLYSPSYDNTLLSTVHEKLPDRTVIFGAPSIDNGIYYNSAYEITPDGQSYRYDKRHLVPFGEYIPFGDWLLSHNIATKTVTTFSARKGEHRPRPDFAGPAPITLICYEGIFPAMARVDGDYIAILTNDIWFGDQAGPYQHLAAARFRAIENGLPVVRSALTGISAIINARGEILDAVPLHEKGAAQAVLGAKYQSTLYHHLGDWPFLVVSALGLAFCLARRRAKG